MHSFLHVSGIRNNSLPVLGLGGIALAQQSTFVGLERGVNFLAMERQPQKRVLLRQPTLGMR